MKKDSKRVKAFHRNYMKSTAPQPFGVPVLIPGGNYPMSDNVIRNEEEQTKQDAHTALEQIKKLSPAEIKALGKQVKK